MSNLEEHITQVISEAVDNAVSKALNDIKQTISTAVTPPYLTKEKVMELTGWSSRTIQHLRDSNQIDYVKHGRKILYPTQPLYDFLDNHRLYNIRKER
ncbi:helix-turn-helix domain-containing protein [Gracilimonas halophila]|uniref:Helix-turn-helix domain-containing protein n=1 Tax=Gracilimonas halophila TaxID=1834464 RepID=A0ABW5JHF2_9BACT